MKISVILGHPQKNSFNHAIAKTVMKILLKNKHEIFFHDLYEEKFDPILKYEEIAKDAKIDSSIQKYCDELKISDGIIIIHPNWWGQPPSILKGCIDRVIRPGVAYEFAETDNGEGLPIGLLKAKTALVFNTSNTPEKREIEVFGDPLEQLWNQCIFNFCGVKIFYRTMYRIICISTDEQREKWLKDVEEKVNMYFPKYKINF